MKQAENLVPFNTDPQEDDGPQVLWDGKNLLKINATSTGKYGRHIGRLIFTSEQLASSMISPTKQTDREEFPEDQKSVWKGSYFRLNWKN